MKFEKDMKNISSPKIKFKLEMQFLNKLGKLNTLKQKIISKIRKTEKLLSKKEITETETKLKIFIEEINHHKRVKDFKNFNNTFFSDIFFRNFNKIFCQICNRIENLSDDDFYISCEVI